MNVDDAQRAAPHVFEVSEQTLAIRRDLKICSIRGRILNAKDIGEYIIRPQPRSTKGCNDWTFVPRQRYERFNELKLLKINFDGTIEFDSNMGTRVFANDEGWLTVRELRAHLDATGESLWPIVAERYSLVRIFTGMECIL